MITLAIVGVLANVFSAQAVFAFNESLLRGAQIISAPATPKLANAFVAGISQGVAPVSSSGFALGMYAVPMAGEVAGAVTSPAVNTLFVNIVLFGLLALALSLLAAMVLEPKKERFEN